MGNSFIQFLDKRIRLSSIKKYEPIAPSVVKRFGIKVFYALGAKPQYDTLWFDTEEDRNSALARIDDELGVSNG